MLYRIRRSAALPTESMRPPLLFLLPSSVFVCLFILTVLRSPPFFFFTLIMPRIHREWIPVAKAPFHCFSGSSRLALRSNPSTFLFGFLLSLIMFLHTLPETIPALRVLTMLNTYISSLGKSLAFRLFVSNNANIMLGDTGDI